jgi:hypothetical protein
LQKKACNEVMGVFRELLVSHRKNNSQEKLLGYEIGEYAPGDLQQRKDALEDEADLKSKMKLLLIN